MEIAQEHTLALVQEQEVAVLLVEADHILLLPDLREAVVVILEEEVQEAVVTAEEVADLLREVVVAEVEEEDKNTLIFINSICRMSS